MAREPRGQQLARHAAQSRRGRETAARHHPTDYRQNKSVVVKSRVPISSAHDRLLTTDRLTVRDNRVELTVQAGAVRIIELK